MIYNRIVGFFFNSILKSTFIKADLYRYFGSVTKESFIKALRIPGFEFTLYFRLAVERNKYSLLGALARWRYPKLFVKYGFQIPRATKVGKGLRISHFGGVVINYNAVIGENCYLSHNVTIGQIPLGTKQGCPTIGNRVWIGPGAVIVGNITIGDDVLIAGNSFVNQDVPRGSLVIGNPSKVISNANATEGYVTYVYKDYPR